jgi:hypothetical protein
VDNLNIHRNVSLLTHPFSGDPDSESGFRYRGGKNGSEEAERLNRRKSFRKWRFKARSFMKVLGKLSTTFLLTAFFLSLKNRVL